MLGFDSVRNSKAIIAAGTAALMLLVSGSALAGTMVRVSTSLGDYTIELFDDITPATVANFLNYVNDGDYNGTYIHRSVPGFVVQGGGYTFVPFNDVLDVPLDPPVVNEFSVSSTRGTVAMAKLEGDPDSATSQWFVNLADNSLILDEQNGGFTVFGEILGDGMDVVDAIAALPTIALGSKASDAPYTGDSYINPDQFVTITTEVVGRFSSSLHVLELDSGLLITSIDLGEEVAFSVNMSLVSTFPDVVFKLNADSLVALANTPGEAAIFNSADSSVQIPSLEVFDGTSVTVLTDVILVLSDAEQFLFTVESFQ